MKTLTFKSVSLNFWKIEDGEALEITLAVKFCYSTLFLEFSWLLMNFTDSVDDSLRCLTAYLSSVSYVWVITGRPCSSPMALYHAGYTGHYSPSTLAHRTQRVTIHRLDHDSPAETTAGVSFTLYRRSILQNWCKKYLVQVCQINWHAWHRQMPPQLCA